jgi:hypothetical protein
MPTIEVSSVVGGMQQTIATVTGIKAGRANASLIAAAPDLLAAMKRIEPHLEAIVCYASTCGEHEPNDIAREFRAAIAKATGSTT